ncbi:alpha/beta fold hydrolase [Pseudomonas syringae]
MTLPLIMLPGLLNDARLWAQQQAVLGKDRPVHIPDLTRDNSIVGMAARVLSAAPERFALAALSMGGYVALEILRQAPERVERLALVDTMARPDSPARARVRRGLLELAHMGTFKGVTPQLLPRLMHTRSLGTPAADLVRAMAQAVGREGFIAQQQAIIGRRDYSALLEQIRVPTLIMVGEDDQITPVEEAQFMHRHIAGSRLVVIAECGHLPPLEHPLQTCELLQAWLSGI